MLIIGHNRITAGEQGRNRMRDIRGIHQKRRDLWGVASPVCPGEKRSNLNGRGKNFLEGQLSKGASGGEIGGILNSEDENLMKGIKRGGGGQPVSVDLLKEPGSGLTASGFTLTGKGIDKKNRGVQIDHRRGFFEEEGRVLRGGISFSIGARRARLSFRA